ncbi:hypothetical protein [Nitrosomonas sp. Nm166]|uniref:hypothetical protein n=1 Tax=Nitrosomonas sp. Nm166 TaxID=1881054 RepID=UPI0008F3EC3F|nr:hypothetical protein [Nitrosomonas sp. Nm166]SFF00916.1 hypothetical protein SAMN05428977_104226 [Nitrosomonas sp. Nm166]
MSKDKNLTFVTLIFVLFFLASTSVLAESSSSSGRMENKESSDRDRLSQPDKSSENQGGKESSDKRNIRSDDQRSSVSGQQSKTDHPASSPSGNPMGGQ